MKILTIQKEHCESQLLTCKKRKEHLNEKENILIDFNKSISCMRKRKIKKEAFTWKHLLKKISSVCSGYTLSLISPVEESFIILWLNTFISVSELNIYQLEFSLANKSTTSKTESSSLPPISICKRHNCRT